MNLFAYGTLMFPEIWERVVGDEFRAAPATVRGMAVYRAAGQLFPVMVASESTECAAGIVVFDLSPRVFETLDAYESDFYERIELHVELDDGRMLAAQTYLLPDRLRDVASDERWTAEWFRREALERYLRQNGW
ncbi:gamma-glutamylcyclotransferase family protein [Lacipirellula limnantheis]|uniref:Putative gamma-glutamylcyclotransferase n=1 Tax=Lacipirellula limnantheis TaxID=2528024 RepID=A0A517TZI1_9BACT|nr:gamma-glutamylcyclotransferase family protein [Lacipirellula limnantheis]QDT73776.1 AIG2-like family protein [Lacipirellula limnantheis]